MSSKGSVATKPLTTKPLRDADLQKGIAVVEGMQSVVRWSKRGKPVADIEMEITTIERNSFTEPNYQKTKDLLCKRYRMSESDFVRQVLHGMTQ